MLALHRAHAHKRLQGRRPTRSDDDHASGGAFPTLHFHLCVIRCPWLPQTGDLILLKAARLAALLIDLFQDLASLVLGIIIAKE